MVILRQATIKYKGYDSDSLTKGSHKRVCVSCDECGRVRWVRFQDYRDLCLSCARLGNKNSFYGKHHSNESKKKISEAREGKVGLSGNKNPNWKGGFDTKVCEICGNEFKTQPSANHRFCCRRCFGKWQSNNILGNKHPNWKGGIAGVRTHVKHERDCIKLNERFQGSEFHHLSRSLGIYIPKELHHHFYHSLKNGHGMGNMNMLSLQFINGGL